MASTKFSGIIQINDLDDFIGPGQECVKPVKLEKPKKPLSKKIEIESAPNEEHMTTMSSAARGETNPTQKAKISLDDCLACSGCVTSAETVLINQQSIDELFKVIESNKKFMEMGKSCHVRRICVSISPQSRASLAVKYGGCGDDLDAFSRKLSGFFRDYLSAEFVFDTTFAREFSLVESAREFATRYRSVRGGGEAKLPVLASACPGWICYAEKTHGSFILPYISGVRSPQQVMGALVKDYLAKHVLDTTPDAVYHVSVMPCYDKKLEASRKDFFNEFHQSRDVDCVLSTVEIEQLLEKEHIDLMSVRDGELQFPFTSERVQLSVVRKELERQSHVYTHSGGGSGGYLEHVLVRAVRELFGRELSADQIVYKTLRNQDYKEVNVEVDGEVKLRFCLAYGFRNIQNIVQKIKKNTCPYDYVEIMACPSGCLNGGGQIREESTNALSKELLEKVDKVYNSVCAQQPGENPFVKRLYDEDWLKNDQEAIKTNLYTNYHAVEKITNGLAIKW